MDIKKIINQIKEFKKRTGLSSGFCSRILKKYNYNLEESINKAVEEIKQEAYLWKDKLKEDKKEGKCYCLQNKNKTVIYEIGCLTDFLSTSEEFLILTKEIGNLLLKYQPENIEEFKKIKIDNYGTIEDFLLSKSFIFKEKITVRRFDFLESNEKSIIGKNMYKENLKNTEGKIASIVLIDNFDNLQLADDIAYQITLKNPLYIDVHEAKEKTQIKDENQLKDICLLDQTFINNKDKKVGDFLKNSKIIKFYRYTLIS
jgi:translation elongation factor EF-Ts